MKRFLKISILTSLVLLFLISLSSVYVSYRDTKYKEKLNSTILTSIPKDMPPIPKKRNNIIKHNFIKQ